MIPACPLWGHSRDGTSHTTAIPWPTEGSGPLSPSLQFLADFGGFLFSHSQSFQQYNCSNHSKAFSWSRFFHSLLCPGHSASPSHPNSAIGYFNLEGTFKGHLVQFPCSKQGYPQPDRVSQGPIQSDLVCSRDGASTISLWATCASISTSSL